MAFIIRRPPGILKGRQELLAKAEAETAAAARCPPGTDPSTPKIGSDATSELADKLSRQQANLKVQIKMCHAMCSLVS